MNKEKLKSLVKDKIQFLGIKTPWLASFALKLFYPIPRLYILTAHMTKMYQPVRHRQWNIKNGPLKGMKLVGLLPAEILPVLTSSMERKNSDLLSVLSLEGIALDIGGSYGYYALLLSNMAEHVYSFEPDWHSFGRLTQNLKLNELKNVTAIPVCVSNSSKGFVRWQSFEDEPWNNRLVDDTSFCDADGLTIVPMVKLDEFVGILKIADKIRLLKIDVEGAELLVLHGAEKILTEVKPLILCELHGRDIAKEVIGFLEGLGYKWIMVEYVNETRQHIFAFPADQLQLYQSLTLN